MGSMRMVVAGVLCAAAASAQTLEPCLLPAGWELKGTPKTCPLIRFVCGKGQEMFTGHECGCGCKPFEKPCVVPDGWEVVAPPNVCPSIRFTCPDGMEYFGGHECGCGCKPKEAETPCVLPIGWDLVGNPEQCRRIRFTCPDDMDIFTGHECGCGCKPKERCPRGYERVGSDCVTAEGRCPHPQIDIIFIGGALLKDPVTGKETTSRSVRCGTWEQCSRWAVRGPASCTIYGM